MRGTQVAKIVALCLIHNLSVKRLAILYLLFCIASHLTTPTTAYYTHKENVAGEMSVSDQLGQTDEPVSDTDEQVGEKELSEETESKSPPSNEPESPAKQNDKLDKDKPVKQGDIEESGQTENTVPNESKPQDSKVDGTDQVSDTKAREERQDSGEEVP